MSPTTPPATDPLRLMLCGDVMTGRGIDQILPHPVDPALYEPHVRDARDYVRLAERENGPIPRAVGFDYVWGEALAALRAFGQPPRIINLETAVTAHDRPWPGKGIHYRMHPDNAPVLTALGTDVAVLANNHLLDWGREGLRETRSTLLAHGIRCAGAGADLAEAASPAILSLDGGRRLLVFGFAVADSGVPATWAAGPSASGVNFLPDLSEASLADAIDAVRRHSRPGDLVVASLHWGGNWGYAIGDAQRRFARGLIDRAGVAIVHGHSSHHPRGMELHAGRLILHGCGDFLNDYEGIGGYAQFRPDLVLMYLPAIAPDTGALAALALVPLRIRRFRLERVSDQDAGWLAGMLTRESGDHGLHVTVADDAFHTLMARFG